MTSGANEKRIPNKNDQNGLIQNFVEGDVVVVKKEESHRNRISEELLKLEPMNKVLLVVLK